MILKLQIEVLFHIKFHILWLKFEAAVKDFKPVITVRKPNTIEDVSRTPVFIFTTHATYGCARLHIDLGASTAG